METIDFNRTPEFTERLPETFLAWLKPLHKTITYNSQLVDALVKEIGYNPEALSRWIYVGRSNLKDDSRKERRAEMLEGGWLLLSETVCADAMAKGKKLELYGAVTSDWLTTQIKGLFRIRKTEKGGYFLIAPRKRNRGYYLGALTEGGYRDCFCKIAS